MELTPQQRANYLSIIRLKYPNWYDKHKDSASDGQVFAFARRLLFDNPKKK